jgi:hypothetical protein
MVRQKSSLAILLMAALCLTACGGGTEPRTQVVVAPADPTRVAGETQQFTAMVDGTQATGASGVSWSSSNTAVATVDPSTGLATAVAAGTTRIRATVRGASGETDFTVVANTAPLASAGVDLDVDRGATVVLTANGHDAEGQALSYRWTQTAGADVTGGQGFLTGATPSFTAPPGVDVLRFSVVATDASGASSAADEVSVFVLEDRTKAIWVRPTGDNDGGAGTRASPFRTITYALAQAVANGADVYVAVGQYVESVALRDDVSLYGGFAADWSARHSVDQLSNRTIVRGTGTALSGNAVTDLTVDGFHLEAESPTVTGASTYGIRLVGSQRVTISRNAISAAPGRAGATGSIGSSGAIGATGGNAPAEVIPGTGGGNGGGGGRGGTESSAATAGAIGGFGSGGGGQGGAPATTDAGGGQGSPGGTGSTGASGSSGGNLGTFGSGFYLPASGSSGGAGRVGGGRNVTSRQQRRAQN